MSEKKTKRRDFLFTATYAVGAVGAGGKDRKGPGRGFMRL